MRLTSFWTLCALALLSPHLTEAGRTGFSPRPKNPIARKPADERSTSPPTPKEDRRTQPEFVADGPFTAAEHDFARSLGVFHVSNPGEGGSDLQEPDWFNPAQVVPLPPAEAQQIQDRAMLPTRLTLLEGNLLKLASDTRMVASRAHKARAGAKKTKRKSSSAHSLMAQITKKVRLADESLETRRAALQREAAEFQVAMGARMEADDVAELEDCSTAQLPAEERNLLALATDTISEEEYRELSRLLEPERTHANIQHVSRCEGCAERRGVHYHSWSANPELTQVADDFDLELELDGLLDMEGLDELAPMSVEQLDAAMAPEDATVPAEVSPNTRPKVPFFEPEYAPSVDRMTSPRPGSRTPKSPRLTDPAPGQPPKSPALAPQKISWDSVADYGNPRSITTWLAAQASN